MKQEIELQKLRMESALTLLEIIEACDKNISNDFYKQKKVVAVNKYAETMTSLVKEIMKSMNLKIEDLFANTKS